MGEESADEGKPRGQVPAGRQAMSQVAFVGELGELKQEAVEDRGEAPPGFKGSRCDSDATLGWVAVKLDLVATECSKAVSASTGRCGEGIRMLDCDIDVEGRRARPPSNDVKDGVLVFALCIG